jgi:PAS domain S-box-containing protein
MSSSRSPIRAPELDELETLVACATEGSLAGAGAKLGISRPAVAKRIRNLEALAGRPLLNRSSAGVSLTSAGTSVIAGAKRMLEERDVLLGVLAEMRSEEPSSIAGLHKLLGEGDLATRMAKLPETRLADAERLLELIMRSTTTAIAITELDTGVVLEANDAFSRFSGRTREQLLGRHASARPEWYESEARRSMLEEVRRTGVVEGVQFTMARHDGAERVGVANAYLVSVGGRTVLLTTIEDLSARSSFDGAAGQQAPAPSARR